MPLTMPSATTLRPLAGSMTFSRTLRTADSVISAMFARSRTSAVQAIFCRRLIAAMAVVTYMQPGAKAKVPLGPRGDGWRGTTTMAALGAAVAAVAVAHGAPAAAVIA